MNARQVQCLAEAGIEAARRVDTLPPSHRQRRLHGHHLSIALRARLPAGWAAFPGAEASTLRERLQAVVAPLDYGLLNDHLDDPSDEGFARWLQAGLGVPGLRRIRIGSRPGAAVWLDEGQRVMVMRRYRFEAAHRLPHVPPGHQCGRMHGHGFEVELRARADGPAALAQDALDALWAPMQARLDHACLNDISGLENPTSECLAAWIWQRLADRAPSLTRVSVIETATAGCHFDGADYRIWKDFRFESATSLARAPGCDPRRRLHGHSYRLRLRLAAPLDAVLGWTLDYGEVKALFKPVYALLDHHRLDRLPDIADGDPASVAHWVAARLAPRLPALERLELRDTPATGMLLETGPA